MPANASGPSGRRHRRESRCVGGPPEPFGCFGWDRSRPILRLSERAKDTAADAGSQWKAGREVAAMKKRTEKTTTGQTAAAPAGRRAKERRVDVKPHVCACAPHGKGQRCKTLAGAVGDTLRQDEAGQVWIRADRLEEILAEVRARIDACLSDLVNRAPLGLAHVTGAALDPLQGLDPATREAARGPIEAGVRVLFEHLERTSNRLLKARADLGDDSAADMQAIDGAKRHHARKCAQPRESARKCAAA